MKKEENYETEINNIQLKDTLSQLQLLSRISPTLQELNSRVTALEKQIRKLNRKLKIKKEKVLL